MRRKLLFFAITFVLSTFLGAADAASRNVLTQNSFPRVFRAETESTRQTHDATHETDRQDARETGWQDTRETGRQDTRETGKGFGDENHELSPARMILGGDCLCKKGTKSAAVNQSAFSAVASIAAEKFSNPKTFPVVIPQIYPHTVERK